MKLILVLLSCFIAFYTLQAQEPKHFAYLHGAITRGDSTRREIALVFTADENGDGIATILQTLKAERIKAGFFFTGRFYRNRSFRKYVYRLKIEGHYLGPHSNAHLLYCDWTRRDSLLVTRDSFAKDMARNLDAMKSIGLSIRRRQLFIPPFEWWNDSIAAWSKARGLRLFNFTPGMRTNADYTWPEMGGTYKSTQWILNWLKEFVATKPNGLNGTLFLLHAGTDERRKDKFYNRLKEAIIILKQNNFRFKRVDELIGY